MRSGSRARWGVRLALLTAALGMPVAGAAEDDDYARAGAELYHQHCGACHGTEGQGDGPVSSLLDPAPPDLTRIRARRDGSFPEAELIRIIDGRDPIVAHGSREMPVWGERFSEGQPPSAGSTAGARGQVLLLVHYLRSIQQEP